MEALENFNSLLLSRDIVGEQGSGAIVILELSGVQNPELLDGYRALFDSQFEAGYHCIVLNMHRVGYLNSPALSALYFACKEARIRGGDLRLCHLTGAIKLAFETMHLDDLFEIHENEEEAIKSFAYNPPLKNSRLDS